MFKIRNFGFKSFFDVTTNHEERRSNGRFLFVQFHHITQDIVLFPISGNLYMVHAVFCSEAPRSPCNVSNGMVYFVQGIGVSIYFHVCPSTRRHRRGIWRSILLR